MGRWISIGLLAVLWAFCRSASASDSAPNSLDVQMQLNGPAAAEGGTRLTYLLKLSIPKVSSEVAKVRRNRVTVTFEAPPALRALSAVPVSTRNWSCSISGSRVTCTNIRDMRFASTTKKKTINVASISGMAPNIAGVLVASAATAISADVPTYTDTVPSNNEARLSTAIEAAVVLRPAAFNAFDASTSPGAINGRLGTRVSGANMPVAVVAVRDGVALNDSFSGTVTVEALNAEDNSGAIDAGNCRSSWTSSLSAASASLSRGRVTLTLPAVPDVYREVRLRISSTVNGATERSCSTDRFAIRPASFVVTASDEDAATAGTGRTLDNVMARGGRVHYADAPFTLRVTAVNALGEVTPRYPLSITASPLVTVASTLQPNNGVSGSLEATLAASGDSGELRADDATFDEAGSVSLSVDDDSFSEVDAGDGSSAAVTRINGTANLGRFVPATFGLAQKVAPAMAVLTESGCTAPTAGYIGQPVQYATVPAWTITPLSAAGNALENYRGNLWKLATVAPTTRCVAGRHMCSADAGSALLAMQYSTSTGATPDWDAGASGFGTPVIDENNDGTGVVRLDAADRFTLDRPAAPLLPFVLTHMLRLTVQDTSEGVTIASPELVTPVVVGSDRFEFRFGQLKLANAYGPEAIDLPLRIEAQYWNGNGFVTNLADSCTRFRASDFALSDFRGGLSGCKAGVRMSGSGRLESGTGTVRIISGKVAGSLNITANLVGEGGISCVGPSQSRAGTATGAARPWLLGKWSGSEKYDRNPSSKVTFGIRHGAEKVIQIREVF